MITASFIKSCYNADPKYFYRAILRKFPSEYAALAEQYGSPVAGLYVIVYGEDSRICVCGGIRTFKTFRDGFSDYCSHACYAMASAPKEKRKKTTIERYGVENCRQSPEIRAKFETTMLERFGVCNALQNKELLEKSKAKFKTNDIEVIKEKRRKTTLERFGFEHATMSPVIKNRVAQTNLSRIGETTPLKNKDVISVAKEMRKSKFFDKLVERAANAGIIPLFQKNQFTCVQQKHPWSCLVCGTTFDNHMDDGVLPRCPVCHPVYDGASKGESELRDFITSLGEDIQSSVKTIIPPKEIDIFVPSRSLAFEYNGVYWHSEGKVGKDYHLNKTKACVEKNIRLIHIFEPEWLFKQDIVKSRIHSMFGFNETKYARCCIIREIDAKTHHTFMEENHLQGSCPSKIRYGLYIGKDLFAVMSFGKSRYTKAEYELLRYANKLNTTVVGGASKLFSHFVKTHNPKTIVSYSDKRWNTGGLYTKLGFKHSHSSSPNYFYSLDGLLLESRIEYQKHKLIDKLETFDPALSEIENMKLNGYKRIFDCGNDVFMWENTV
jgi:rubrerythrin